jgi:hypothetical protein
VAAECVVVLGRRGRDALVEESWAAVEAALERLRPRGAARLPDADVARLAWALVDQEVRDRALVLATGPDADLAELLWTECTRRAPEPLDAAPATLVAVHAWLRGDGAMAGIALERALASDPGCPLAGLLVEGLQVFLPPDELRRWIRTAAEGTAPDERTPVGGGAGPREFSGAVRPLPDHRGWVGREDRGNGARDAEDGSG